MARQPAKSAGAARVAVVGAPTPEGTHLREALAEFGVPGGQVDLYATTGGETLLTEYDGEARMIQEPDVEEIAAHEVVFLCETGELARKILARAGERTLIIDLRRSLPVDSGAQMLDLDAPAPAATGDRDHARCFRVAHPLALLLAEVLGPLDRAFGVEEAVAVILRPAADFGPDGLEELREQTVRLLNFAPVPTATFGRQLAFNIIPQQQIDSDEPQLEQRIAREVGDRLGWGELRVSVRMLTAPLFHGHGLQVRVRPARQVGIDDARRALDAAGLPPSNLEAGPATPLEVTGEARTILTSLNEDGLGAFWLWAIAGEAATRGAREAVRLAARLVDL